MPAPDHVEPQVKRALGQRRQIRVMMVQIYSGGSDQYSELHKYENGEVYLVNPSTGQQLRCDTTMTAYGIQAIIVNEGMRNTAYRESDRPWPS